MFAYDRSLLLSSSTEFVCWDVIYVPLHSVNGKVFFFPLGLLFVGVCGILFNVLSRSVFSFFCRGLLDETVAFCKVWSVYGAYLIDIPFLYSIVFYVECRHTQLFYSHVEFLF